MSELLTAAEKRKKYDTATNQSLQAELETVTKIINNSSGTFVRFNKQLSEPVKAILIGKGYKCGYVQTDMNESEYEVSW